MTTTLSSRTITRDLNRASKFLGTLSRSPRIWRIMANAAGYSQEAHDEGWRMFLDVLGYHHRPLEEIEVTSPNAQQLAISSLDNWDGDAFGRARAALERAFPVQHDSVFRGLSAGTGAFSVGTTRTFLDRVQELREGSEEDRAAAQLLADRKILDAETEERLERWLEEAQLPAPAIGDEPPEDPARMQSAIELHQFLKDWSAQARSVIRRRDYLVRLGLATQRRSNAEPEPESDGDESEAA